MLLIIERDRDRQTEKERLADRQTDRQRELELENYTLQVMSFKFSQTCLTTSPKILISTKSQDIIIIIEREREKGGLSLIHI